ncbi:hypothetical protein BGZ47_011248 [Haplosporangium gracile]|nr:hypothetical protein BGZ47_011248 [Haplosporangium gracile]
MTRLLTTLTPFRFFAFHFSVCDKFQTLDDFYHKMIDICPEATERSMRPYDTVLQILQELEPLSNVITTLELSRLYCTVTTKRAASPTSVSSITRTSTSQLEGMDIHRCSLFGDLNHWSKYRFINTAVTNKGAITPGIWACRALEILHINFHRHEEYGLRSPVYSRIIFGYISIVCPNLTDLQLTASSERRKRNNAYIKNTSQAYFTHFCMRLEGGFCLLSRLKYLTTLHLDTYSISRKSGCWPVDLNWLVAEGNKPQSREKRHQVVVKWDDKLDIEKRLKNESLSTGARYAKKFALENGDYVEEEEEEGEERKEDWRGN